MKTFSSIRVSPIAGSWYPDNPAILSAMIDEFISAATIPPLNGEVLGLVSPHAGYFYSGVTAGHAYKAVLGKEFDTVAIFSPLHDYLPNQLITTTHDAYQTPLGEVPVNQPLVQDCINNLREIIGEDLQPVANDHEHSLEIQLPFLQRALARPFQLLPIMVRSHDPELIRKSAEVIANLLSGKNVLLVSSTDLSHFYSNSQAQKLDKLMMRHIGAFSPVGVLHAEATGEAFACGAGAVAMVLWISKYLGGQNVSLLHQSTSADASGDTSRVVGYGAAAITR
jgi:MEMO1 family protein